MTESWDADPDLDLPSGPFSLAIHLSSSTAPNSDQDTETESSSGGASALFSGVEEGIEWGDEDDLLPAAEVRTKEDENQSSTDSSRSGTLKGLGNLFSSLSLKAGEPSTPTSATFEPPVTPGDSSSTPVQTPSPATPLAQQQQSKTSTLRLSSSLSALLSSATAGPGKVTHLGSTPHGAAKSVVGDWDEDLDFSLPADLGSRPLRAKSSFASHISVETDDEFDTSLPTPRMTLRRPSGTGRGSPSRVAGPTGELDEFDESDFELPSDLAKITLSPLLMRPSMASIASSADGSSPATIPQSTSTSSLQLPQFRTPNRGPSPPASSRGGDTSAEEEDDDEAFFQEIELPPFLGGPGAMTPPSDGDGQTSKVDLQAMLKSKLAARGSTEPFPSSPTAVKKGKSNGDSRLDGYREGQEDVEHGLEMDASEPDILERDDHRQAHNSSSSLELYFHPRQHFDRYQRVPSSTNGVNLGCSQSISVQRNFADSVERFPPRFGTTSSTTIIGAKWRLDKDRQDEYSRAAHRRTSPCTQHGPEGSDSPQDHEHFLSGVELVNSDCKENTAKDRYRHHDSPKPSSLSCAERTVDAVGPKQNSSNQKVAREPPRHSSVCSLRPPSRSSSSGIINRLAQPTLASASKARPRVSSGLLDGVSIPSAPLTFSRPKRARQYGDGTELDAFDDLPTSKDRESNVRPSASRRSSTASGASVPSSPSPTKDTKLVKRHIGATTSSARAAASAVGKTMAKATEVAMQLKPPGLKSRLPIKRLKEERSSGAEDSVEKRVKSEPAASEKAEKKRKAPKKEPHLIRNLGLAVPKVQGEMKWNPIQQKWEGNEGVLRDFDKALSTSTRPALITQLSSGSPHRPGFPFFPSSATTITTNRSNVKVVGSMVFDPVRMSWFSISSEEDELDLTMGEGDMADDEGEFEDGWEKGEQARMLKNRASFIVSEGSRDGESDTDDGERRAIWGESVQAEQRHREEMAKWALKAVGGDHVDRGFLFSLRTRGTGVKGIKKVVVFGDSLSDSGFSNGPVYAEDLAGFLSAPIYDYAVGGATTNNTLVQGYTGPSSTIPVPSVLDQIDDYLIDHTPSSSTLFVLYGGANDAFFGLPNITGLDSVRSLEGGVAKLKQAGAKHFLLPTLPPIGRHYPFAVLVPSYAPLLETFANEFRYELLKLRDQDSSIVVSDLYGLFKGIFATPEKYGFNASTIDESCLRGVYMEVEGGVAVCSNPRTYVWWDEYHPTKVVHKLIAKVLLKSIKEHKW
ncbi:hypothetical protein MNV49_004831 [Pseudohyphozyma bogoriensis]|nr:hypothetical protein MNV49_004831 [Pseudohyphozyma bogoriensis]